MIKYDAIRIGEGSLLIATSSFVDLNIMSSMQTMQSQNTASALSQHSQISQSRKRYLYIGNTESVTALTVMQLIKKNKMHDECKRLLQNPEQYSANHTFDDVLSFTCTFYIIEPIVSKSENYDVALTKLLGILGVCGLGSISIFSLKAMCNEGPHILPFVI